MSGVEERVRQQASPDSSPVFWTVLVLASVLAAALRLSGIGSPSFWVDEFFSIARAGVDDLHWTYALGYQPTRLSLWLSGADLTEVSLDNIVAWQALGVTERGARLGPAWVGIASVPLLALLARPVVGAAVAGVAAFFLAIVPYHIYWSQMARHYTTEFLFANAFLLLFLRGLQTGSRAVFVSAAIAGVLAFASHFTALFVIGGCLGLVGVAWLAKLPLPHLRVGLRSLAATTGVCVLMLVVKELGVSKAASLGSFATQEWSPSFVTLILGTVLRFEPALIAAGAGWLVIAARRRDPFWLLIGAAALLVPAGVLALKPFFPVGQRYYFTSLFPWCLLAAAWVVDTGRLSLANARGLAAVTALALVSVAVGFDTYLYARDGAGARARWREGYEHVLRHGEPGDAVFVGAGAFQARYYLERPARGFAELETAAPWSPGTWVVERTRGSAVARYADRFDAEARFEISSKPWSWVVNVLRVPAR